MALESAPLVTIEPPRTSPEPTAAKADGPELAVPEAAPAGPSGTAASQKPAASPYKGLFYDNDFQYLDDPTATRHLGDSLKRKHFGSSAILDVGGEYRARHHNEHILTRDNNFILQRTRLYADLHYQDWFRTYAEAVDATSSWEDLPPRGIEENRFDALNLFADARLWNGDDNKVWIRGGRQELLYGAQRLISPLDWSNTRRTFDGVKLFSRGENWNVDGFWTRPVPFAQHSGNDHNFDHPDISQEFAGLYLTRKGMENLTVDAYYLRYAEYEGAPDFDYNTLGSRWEGKHGNWLWEAEGGYQFGDFGPLDHSAAFYTLGGGRKFVRFLGKPTLWIYYDWASGDRDPTNDVHRTFNQLFPLGHKYLGYMDLVARQNIKDWNFLWTIAVSQKTEFQIWYHMFTLQQPRDALYDAGGAVIRHDPTGASGSDVGDELDLLLKHTMSPRSDVLFGYSHLFPGDFLLNTPGGAPGHDFYYTQFAVRF